MIKLSFGMDVSYTNIVTLNPITYLRAEWSNWHKENVKTVLPELG